MASTTQNSTVNCNVFSPGAAPQGTYAICMEVLRGLVILLGLSMLFSIVTSILRASEELRDTFPRNEYDKTPEEISPITSLRSSEDVTEVKKYKDLSDVERTDTN